MREYLKPTLLGFFSLLLISSVSAQSLFSIVDGWDETDNDYATGDDLITISWGSTLDSRYVFDASSYVDTYCIELQGTSSRSANFLVNGELIHLPIWGYAENDFGGNVWTIKYTGGTTNYCRFSLWKDKACDEVWATQTDTSYSVGCEPDLYSQTLYEGDVDVYTIGGDDVEVTCISAITDNYVKCQAPTSSDLDDCIQSSLDDDGGGDDFNLGDFCIAGQTSSSSDTEKNCDVKTLGSTWEISLFGSDTLNADREKLYKEGIPNASFSLYAYDGCGTGLFDRDLVENFNIVQYDSLSRVCDSYGDYSIVGSVTGYSPWFGTNGDIYENYTLGSNSCDSGYACVEQTPVQDETVGDANACTLAGGTCYDNLLNRDEVETDYGGAFCGNCSEISKKDDIYWAVAIETYPKGFFDIAKPFNSSIYCPEAEDSAGFMIIVVLIASALLLALVVFVFTLISGALFSLVIIPYIKGLFKKKEQKKKVLNNT